MAHNDALVLPDRMTPSESNEPASCLVGKSPAASRHNSSISGLAAHSIAPLADIIIGPQCRLAAKALSMSRREIDEDPPQRLQLTQERGPFEGGVAEDQSVSRKVLPIVQGERRHDHAVFARAPGDLDVVKARTTIPERLNA